MAQALTKFELVNNLVLQTCYHCGTPFGIESQLDTNLRENHHTFYCPVGHGQCYTGKTEAQKLREEIAEKDRKFSAELTLRLDTERELARVKKRIGNGVCPCCKRSFSNLHKHMKNKHPKYSEKKPVQI